MTALKKKNITIMYVHPDAKLNHFVDVKIPSAEELFNQFGYKKVSGHPDNLDGIKFDTPSNLHGVSQQDRINMELAYLQQEVASYMKPTSEAVKAEDSVEATSAEKEDTDSATSKK